MLLPLAGFSQDTVSFPAPGNDNGIFCNSATTWDGTSWSNGNPAADKDVIFAADYSQNGGTFHACSVYIENGAQISFVNNANAVVIHSVNVQDGSEMIFESGCNLVQIENDLNTGAVTIKRNSSEIKKDEFTLWASPVSGSQTLTDFSPETLLNRFYTFSTADNIYNTVSNPSATTFAQAKGYLVRTPEDHPETPSIVEAKFTGVPNTGDVTIPLTYINNNKAYNAVGNPYPSPISIKKFLDANTENIDGTIWLWRKTDDAGKSSYSTVTRLGFQSNVSAEDMAENSFLADPYSITEEGLINTAQAFIVKAKTGADLEFDNSMRLAISSQGFFSNNDTEPAVSRYWLNMSGEGSKFSQILVGYTEEGTTGYDNGLDGESLLDCGFVLYSIASDKKLAIQARPEFEDEDEIAIGFKTSTAGTFQIAIDHKDGLFENGQEIYLVDQLTGIQHNLTEGSYSFTSEAGTFESRFRIIYASTLGTEPVATTQDTVLVYSKDRKITIESPVNIDAVVISDLLGRNIYQTNDVAAETFSVNISAQPQQVVIVNIITENSRQVSKKIILN